MSAIEKVSAIANASGQPAAGLPELVDTSDVPAVGARELVLALKLLSGAKDVFLPRHSLSEDDLRRVEQFFWKFSKRDRRRKVAVLLRFRSLLEAVQSRRIAELLTHHGQEALIAALTVAATMRLNAKWGFNPHKLARAVTETLAKATLPQSGLGAAA